MKKFFKSVYEYIKYSDKLLLALCLSVSGLGVLLMLSLYSNNFFTSVKPVIIQCVAILLGVCVAVFFSLIDYRQFAAAWKVHLPFTLGLTLITFIPGVAYTPAGTDDKAWLNLFGITTFQPSELLKITFVFTLAYHISLVKKHINKPSTLILVCLHGLAPVLLITLQGDNGSAVVFFMIFLTMLFVAGLSWKYIIGGLVSLGVLIPFVWFFIFKDVHRRRFEIVINPELDPLGGGLQQIQGRIAMGSGQLFGKGLFGSNLADNVPYVHNDFIFSYIGQTLGFIGCIFTVLLLAAICVKILFVARMAKDDLGAFVCVGIFAIFFFQSVINIGMVLVVLPVIGVTLPFLSAGGTSAVTSFLAIGAVLSVYYHNKQKSIFDN